MLLVWARRTPDVVIVIVCCLDVGVPLEDAVGASFAVVAGPIGRELDEKRKVGSEAAVSHAGGQGVLRALPGVRGRYVNMA